MARNRTPVQTAPAPIQSRSNRAVPPPPQSIQSGNERIQVLDSGPIEEEEIRDIASRDGAYMAPAVDFDDLEEQAQIGPPVHRYEVINGGRVQTQRNGQRTVVIAGKVCDDLNFDIALMRQQGIKFRDVTDEPLASTG